MRWDLTGVFNCPDCNGSGIDDNKIVDVINDCDNDNDNKLSIMSVDNQRRWIADNIGYGCMKCDKCNGNGVVEVELSEDGYQYVQLI